MAAASTEEEENRAEFHQKFLRVKRQLHVNILLIISEEGGLRGSVGEHTMVW